jgi:hypothetical protein
MSRFDPLAEIGSSYVTAADRAFVAARIGEERARLCDPAHLVARVIGQTEFEWDFEPIGPGFLDIAEPFLTTPSGAGAVFHAMLREFGIERSGARHAAVILEFVHYSTRMNDHFNYHDAFAETTPDPPTAERLVQLRYGAQWLNNYPRWLIVQNELAASPSQRVAIHAWGHHSFTSTGIARAAFVRYAQRGFAEVTTGNWLTLAPGLLCEQLISPGVMACVLAGCDESTIAAVKRAFSNLAVAMKARCERRTLEHGFELPSEPEHEVALPMAFPGVAVTSVRPRIERSDVAGTRFPRVRAMVAALANAPGVRTDATIAGARALEVEHAARFRAELADAGVLPGAARLADVFSRT